MTHLTVPKPRLIMIRSIQASALFTAETNSATRIKPFAVVEGEKNGRRKERREEGRGGRKGKEGRKEGREKEEGREGERKRGREREKSMIAVARSYTVNLRSFPKLTELYCDTKNIFSRNPRMIIAPIQNYIEWKEKEGGERQSEEKRYREERRRVISVRSESIFCAHCILFSPEVVPGLCTSKPSE